ncbi:MAG: hypothetical protein IT322_20755 [Anaerolineae bacterium]|nr:hypothetical protein [Anaerolineae bacterium]
MSSFIDITPDNELTALEQNDLERLEGVIAKGLATFMAVGEALTEIQSRRLYRASFATFESYCHARWGFSRSRAYRLIAAADVVQNLSPIGDTLPTTESQARELTSLSTEQAQHAWQRALVLAEGKQPTALDVRRAVNELRQGLDYPPPQQGVEGSSYPQLRPSAFYLFSVRHSAILDVPFAYEGSAQSEKQRLIREKHIDVSWSVASAAYIAHHYKGYQVVTLDDLELPAADDVGVSLVGENEEEAFAESQYPFEDEDDAEIGDGEPDEDDPEWLAQLGKETWYLVNYDEQVIYLPGFPKWADANHAFNLNAEKALIKLHQGMGIRRLPNLRRFRTAPLPTPGALPSPTPPSLADSDAQYLDELLYDFANAYRVIKPFAEGDPDRFLAHLERKQDFGPELLSLFRSLVE